MGGEKTNSDHNTNVLRVYGVDFSMNNNNLVISSNFDCIKNKIKKRIETFRRLGLSLPGKVLLVNTSINSLLYHLSSVYLPANKLFWKELRREIFSYIWDGKREAIARSMIHTPKALGGLGLENPESKCKSIHLYHNILRPAKTTFSHQRKRLFRFYYSYQLRKLYPEIYSNLEPHNFQLPHIYKHIDMVKHEVQEHLENIGPLVPATSQIYEWFEGEQRDVEIKLESSIVDIQSQTRDKLFKLWSEFGISATNKCFMWRLALGGLKTGSFIKKYNIPGTRCECVFCGHSIETPEHLFASCTQLRAARGHVVGYVKRFGGLRDALQSLLFCTGLAGVEMLKEFKTEIFNVVAEANKLIWSVRNDILFNKNSENQTSKIEGLVKALISRKARTAVESGWIYNTTESDPSVV